MKKIYFLFMLVLLFTALSVNKVSAQGNSVWINGGIAKYPSITAAYAAIPLNTNVNYLIELQTTYKGTDKSEIYPISLTDKGPLATGTITIRPALNNKKAVIQNVVSSYKRPLEINGGDHIILDGRPGGIDEKSANLLSVINLHKDGSTKAFVIYPASANNIIKYIKFLVFHAEVGSGGNIEVNESPETYNNMFLHNVIEGGYYGISMRNPVSLNKTKGSDAYLYKGHTIISDNVIKDFLCSGIMLQDDVQDSLTIKNNSITLTTTGVNGSGEIGFYISGIEFRGKTKTITNIVNNTVSIKPLATNQDAVSLIGILYPTWYNNNSIINIIGNNITNLNLLTSVFNDKAAIAGILVVGDQIGCTINVQKNKISDLSTGTTLAIHGIEISSPQNLSSIINVDNNMIDITSPNTKASQIFGIYFDNQNTNKNSSNVYFNTINIGGAHNANNGSFLVAAGIYRKEEGTSSMYNQKNNVVIMNRTSTIPGKYLTGFYNDNTNGTLDIDYNTYYGNTGSGVNKSYAAYSPVTATYYTNTQLALAAYKTAAFPQEQHSIFQSVNFVSNTNLHLAGASINDVNLHGLPMAVLNHDIDGDLRINYFMGADEGSLIFNSAKNEGIANPAFYPVNTGIANLSIYPNPAKDVIFLSFDAAKANKAVISITDINGKQVYRQDEIITLGNNNFTVPIINFTKGTYIIKVQLSNDVVVKKFNKL